MNKLSKVRCEVTGPYEVAGVKRPGVVELDDERIHVHALVRAGHVRLAPKTDDKSTSETKTKTDDGGKTAGGS